MKAHTRVSPDERKRYAEQVRHHMRGLFEELRCVLIQSRSYL